jgi:hypothetical protein
MINDLNYYHILCLIILIIQISRNSNELMSSHIKLNDHIISQITNHINIIKLS